MTSLGLGALFWLGDTKDKLLILLSAGRMAANSKGVSLKTRPASVVAVAYV